MRGLGLPLGAKGSMALVLAFIPAYAMAQGEGMRPGVGSPFSVRDAFPQSHRDLQIEGRFGWTRNRDASDSFAPRPAVKYGVAEGLELRLGGTQNLEGSSRNTGITVGGFRWRAADQQGWRPALALLGEVSVPYQGPASVQTEISAITSHVTGRGAGHWGLHLNGGWLARPEPRNGERENGYRLGMAISHVLDSDTLLAVAYAHQSQDRGERALSVIEAGMQRDLGDGFSLSLVAGAGLNRDSPAFRLRTSVKYSFSLGR